MAENKGSWLGLLGLGKNSGPYYDIDEPLSAKNTKKAIAASEEVTKRNKKRKSPSASGDNLSMDDWLERERQKK